MNQVDFKTTGYFPGYIIFLGILLIVVGVALFFKSLIISIILFLVSAVIFTTHNRLRVDYDKKIFLDYLWILGLKHGENCSFDTIHYIYIRKAMVSQKMNTRVSTTTVRKELYKGYLKFSEEERIFLAEDGSKEKLVARLRIMSRKLGVDIADYSSDEPKKW